MGLRAALNVLQLGIGAVNRGLDLLPCSINLRLDSCLDRVNVRLDGIDGIAGRVDVGLCLLVCELDVGLDSVLGNTCVVRGCAEDGGGGGLEGVEDGVDGGVGRGMCLVFGGFVGVLKAFGACL